MKSTIIYPKFLIFRKYILNEPDTINSTQNMLSTNRPNE